MTLVGKCLYRTACRVKLAWDADLKGRLKLGWEQGLPKQIAVSLALADRREPIQEIKLHGFVINYALLGLPKKVQCCSEH